MTDMTNFRQHLDNAIALVSRMRPETDVDLNADTDLVEELEFDNVDVILLEILIEEVHGLKVRLESGKGPILIAHVASLMQLAPKADVKLDPHFPEPRIVRGHNMVDPDYE